MKKKLTLIVPIGLSIIFSNSSLAAENQNIAACKNLPTHAQLKQAIDSAHATDKTENGGFGLNMWGTLVNRDGAVCGIAFSGNDRGDQWPGSRAISASKAYTANAYSLPNLALSTANLYASGQPGGSLWGLQFSNPLNSEKAITTGNPIRYGQHNDPMVGQKVGGQIVFGGGFALYDKNGILVGGLGVSGDTSCKDHNFGWRVRHALNLDFVPGGVNPDTTRPDNIIYDMGMASNGLVTSPSAFGHTDCGLGEKTISLSLPPVQHP
jgi:uncharacterized protein GlcG (DUF336 family)